MKQRASLNDGNAAKADAAETRWQQLGRCRSPAAPSPAAVGADGAATVPTAAASPCAASGLEIDGLTDPFDLEVHLGDRVAVLGPNGTGKSHLLRLLGGDPTVDHDGSLRLGARVQVGLFHQTDEVAAFAGRSPSPCSAATTTWSRRPGMKALARYGLAELRPPSVRDAVGRPAGPAPDPVASSCRA